MNLLNNQIQKIPGISRTETFISLDQQIGRQITL
jgi:Lrp/AsnC family transcriptional regulator for asnA, asnC and gidA